VPLSRSQRLRRTDAAPETLGIGPEEYFVWSRVEGTPTVGDVLDGSGLPPTEAEKILSRLVEVGALEKAEGTVATRPTKPIDLRSPELRKRADSRRRLLLQKQFGGAGEAGRARTPTPKPEPAAVEDEPEPLPELVIKLVEPDDPRIDHALPIAPNEQRRLLALDDRFEDLTPFELLGILPTDDEKRIKKGYFESSRQLHPDAYYGKHIGTYKARLDKLFARAKQAYAELRKPEVRRPYVVVHEAQIAEAEAKARAVREKAERLEAEQRAAARDEMRATRVHRQQERAKERERRLKDKLDSQVEDYVVEAHKALEVKNLARASNFFRLALQSDPNNAELRQRWEETRTEARKERAKVAYGHAMTYIEIGQMPEAISLVVEAAEADPTAEHLAHAADLLRTTDPVRARDFALKGLEKLNAGMQRQKPAFDLTMATRMRLMIARAFVAAGQKRTAAELAKLAKEAHPDDPEVAALLKSIKVT
jgi:curved DNA-binding protein CbpA